MTHTRRERDALLRNGRPTKQETLKVPVETKGYSGDRLEDITKSMKYTPPKIGDHVFKVGKYVRVCSNRGCYRAVVVVRICDNGAVEYHCPKHGKRNRQQMRFMDITGSTMLQFEPSKMVEWQPFKETEQ